MRSKNAIKNIGYSLLNQVVALVCGFIVPILIISTFGSNVNGLISSIAQFLAYITLLESGVGQVVRAKLYKPISQKNEIEIVNILYSSDKFFKKIAKIFIIYILLLFIVYPLMVSNDFNYLFTISLLLIISLSTFAEYYFGITYSLFLQSVQKSYIVSNFHTASTIVNTLIIVIMAKIGAGIILIKLVSGAFLIFRPIMLSTYVKKKYKLNLKNADKKYELKNKWDGFAQHVAYVVHSNTDITLLTIFCNVYEISVYTVHMLIVTGVKNLISAFTSGVDASFGDMIAKGEIKSLNKRFSSYEFFYYSLITIVYTCTLSLIVPFVSIYTLGVKDVNYIRPLFAFLIVFAEFMYSIRLPYTALTSAAGHFRQTMKGAWFEAILNITISIILVLKFGIVGVAIGTLFAMTIRTIEFNIHSSRYILKRNVFKGFKYILLSLIEAVLLYFIFKNISIIEVTNYMDWFLLAIIIFIISTFVILTINTIFNRKDVNELLSFIKQILKKGERKDKLFYQK